MSDDDEFYPEAHTRLVVLLVEALSTAIDDPVIQADPATLDVARVLFDSLAENAGDLFDNPSRLPAQMSGAIAKLKGLRDPKRMLLDSMVREYLADPSRWKSQGTFITEAKEKTKYAKRHIERVLKAVRD